MAKIITIYDIAKEADVSTATVSRVLTNSANVRQEKRERVLKLIEKYNFKPNALARGLSDTKSKVIGIIAADVRNPYYAEIFVACEVAARQAGYTVLLCNSLGEIEEEEKQLEKLKEQRAEAIIQIGSRADDLQSNLEYVEKVNLMTGNIPMVVTGKLDGTQCYQVQIDAMKCTELLMEYLIGCNHKKIALIGGRMDVFSTFEKRQKYKQVLLKHHLEVREEFIGEEGGYDYETGYGCMNAMLDHHHIPTAVIGINDFAAAGIMRSIIEHQYRIPEDISVVSYDNTYVTRLMVPSLTSVDYNYEQYGKCLIDTAIAAIRGKEVGKTQFVEPTLVIRKSSGPARE